MVIVSTDRTDCSGTDCNFMEQHPAKITQDDFDSI